MEIVRDRFFADSVIDNPYSTVGRKEAQRLQRVLITPDEPELVGKYKTGAYTVVFIDATDGAIEITMPDAESSTELIKLKRIDNTGNSVTVQGQLGQTINLEDSIDIYALETIDMVSNGEHWWY